mmetsp:Transcript_98591/g.316362  ORF Transcript_98591/g.316362 Transcript_98591/m.316362 type:complete len:265 (+) Transcript_98591:226-1020(+)
MPVGRGSVLPDISEVPVCAPSGFIRETSPPPGLVSPKTEFRRSLRKSPSPSLEFAPTRLLEMTSPPRGASSAQIRDGEFQRGLRNSAAWESSLDRGGARRLPFWRVQTLERSKCLLDWPPLAVSVHPFPRVLDDCHLKYWQVQRWWACWVWLSCSSSNFAAEMEHQLQRQRSPTACRWTITAMWMVALPLSGTKAACSSVRAAMRQACCFRTVARPMLLMRRLPQLGTQSLAAGAAGSEKPPAFCGRVRRGSTQGTLKSTSRHW